MKLTQSQIKKIFNKARRIVKHPGLDLLVAPVQERAGQLFVITPAKIGTAVQRNTIRRRIKEIFRAQKLNQKEYDFVIFVKTAGIHLSYNQLKLIIISALNENNI